MRRHLPAQAADRQIEKQRSREADERDLRTGAVTAKQLKRDNESFAFPREHVRLRLDRAKSLS